MNEQRNIRKVAILTYNRIGSGKYDNGVVSGPNALLFVAQNDEKGKWSSPSGTPSEQSAKIKADLAKNLIERFNLTDMDHIYIYVGTEGGEEMIKRSKKLAPEKVTYVMCRCNWGFKISLIKKFGHQNPKIISCECGGRETLAKIAEELLK